MRHLAVIVAVGAILTALVAFPALAQSGCERAHECGEGQAWANPAGQPTSLYTWDPLAGYGHETYAYGLVALCQNYGGYYYLAADGTWYWFGC